MTGPAPCPAKPWAFGRPVAGYQWPTADPRATLLLQHGYAEYAERHAVEYARLIPHLVARGIHVFAFDMTGHGASPGPRGVVDVAEEVKNHIAARHRLARLGLPLFLFGHSLGGLVTTASVLDDDRNLAGVILSSPALLSPSDEAMRRAYAAIAATEPAMEIIPQQTAGRLSRIDDYVARSVADPRIYRGGLTARLVASALAASHDIRQRYASWTSPVAAFHGDADPFTDPDGSREFIERIASCDKLLVMVPGGHHELLNDLGGERVLSAMLDWIETRLEPRSWQ